MQCHWVKFYGMCIWNNRKEVTPLIDRIARNTAELSDITFKVAKERIYQRLSFVLQKWNAHSIAIKLDAFV